MTKDTTHFGFQTVAKKDKQKLVRGVFDSVARRYDLMNDVMSLGAHRLWKRFTVDLANVRAGEQVLDLAGGTGDLAAAFSPRVGAKGLVVLSDINAVMLQEGRRRLLDAGRLSGLAFAQANAETLPFADESFDCITIGFGLRNVTDKLKALSSMLRVLKSGGRLLVLEFSKPQLPGLDKIYDQYSFKILPLMGRVIADDEASYRYLAESIRKHPDQEALKAMMEDVGYQRVQYYNLTGGVVAVHRGYKLA
ncbi:MAG: bifunctional demethylmenaquinone methyltransferase/2-methoxy-6-polyprenyl-1,4-benzoquinol methylase UbiE [Nevskiales bacterium]